MPSDTATRGHRRPVTAPELFCSPPALRQFSPVQPTGCRAAQYRAVSAGNSPPVSKRFSAQVAKRCLLCAILWVPPPSSNAPRTAPARTQHQQRIAGMLQELRSRWSPAGENPLLSGPGNTQPGAEFPGYPGETCASRRGFKHFARRYIPQSGSSSFQRRPVCHPADFPAGAKSVFGSRKSHIIPRSDRLHAAA
ncbi:hypothetical protein KCP73_01650 [Salmonella enterica subsp. enterica]|nr:hypothetical protein KCP73_01650 [Salmonella enterica subsp. enterica]